MAWERKDLIVAWSIENSALTVPPFAAWEVVKASMAVWAALSFSNCWVLAIWLVTVYKLVFY